ncbi:MAG: hypothetical protein ACK56W_00920 [Pirellula sp.]|nr:hypothetical protein [Pirellula sp.]
MKILLRVFAITACCTTPLFAEDFRILAWNVESNRPNSPAVSNNVVIGKQLTELLSAANTRSHLIALSEVEPKSVFILRDAAAKGLGNEVDFVTSASGGFQDSDTLMLIVDKKRFRIEETFELHRFAGIAANFCVAETGNEIGTLRARSPLAVKVVDLTTSKPCWIVVNHLARGEADLRTDQAKMLVKWAATKSEPVISAGDHNFDFDFKTQQGNDGYKAMIEGGVWSWLKPDPLIDSNWADDRRVNDKRVDRYPDSILDFIFVANQAKEWNGRCSVIVRDGDFPDSNETSDHRPIIATLSPK